MFTPLNFKLVLKKRAFAIHLFLGLFLRYFLKLKHFSDDLTKLTNFESQKPYLTISTVSSVQAFSVFSSFGGFVCFV